MNFDCCFPARLGKNFVQSLPIHTRQKGNMLEIISMKIKTHNKIDTNNNKLSYYL